MKHKKKPDPFEERILEILKRKTFPFGLTLEQYIQLFKKQKGKCAICGISQESLEPCFVVDHDHETGEIRGLLCPSCNTTLGFYDNYEKYKERFENYIKTTDRRAGKLNKELLKNFDGSIRSTIQLYKCLKKKLSKEKE